jgi:ABC-2 type transport system ATP-binding protein
MIEVKNLSKMYGTTKAIDEISFSVAKGEIIGFLGPNGAGKTTTMRILTGFLPATEGTVKIAGYDVYSQSLEVRRNIGYLPETPPLYTDMTVEGYLHFVARIKGIYGKQCTKKVNRVMELCQIEDKSKILINKLSKGYRQRVGIAQAIVHEPPVIILDEPTVGLDPRQIIEVRNLIKSLRGEHTIILSTHILPEVSMTCDRITIINRGKVIATNTPENLMTELSAGAGYHLEIVGDVNQIMSKIVAIPGVSDVKIENQNNNNCSLQITSELNSEIGQEIAKITVNSGLGLAEMRQTRPTLEDIFIQLTTIENLETENE